MEILTGYCPYGARLRGCAAVLGLLALCLGTGALAQEAGQRRDLLTNGGFEQGDAGWQLDSGHQLVTDATQAHAGSACLFGEVTKPNQSWRLLRQVKVNTRSLYEFEVWARATNKTKLVLWCIQPGTKQRSMVRAWESITGKWARYSTPLTASGDGMLELHVISPSSHGAPAGKIWIDDVALYETALPDTVSVSADRGFNDEPTMVRATDGSTYVAWNSFGDGGDSLRLARYARDAAGVLARQGEWQVTGAKASYVLGPRLVSTGSAVALLYAGETSESEWDLFRVDAGPSGPAQPVRLTRDAGINIKPDGAWDGSRLWLAWEGNRSSWRCIYAAAGGGGGADSAELVSADECPNYGPSVAVLGNGEVCVAWHSFREHNYDIYLRRRSAAGAWGPEQRLTRAPSIDRHPVLFTRGTDELWLTYENTTTGKYSIGATNRRRLIVARVEPDGTLSAPKGLAKSALFGRCEAGCPAFDESGRLWISHLRPRTPRAGWDTFLTGYTGESWMPLWRASAAKGMDRVPSLVIDGNKAVIVCQNDNLPVTWGKVEDTPDATSNVFLAEVDISKAAAATALALEPLVESADAFEAAALRVARGEDAETPSIDYRGRTLKLFYGDLHEHSNISVCNRLGDQSVDESYQHMRDIVRLDFACVTDHGYNINPYLWGFTAKLARVNHDPGRFLTFLAEEWTSSIEKYSEEYPYGYHGHRNLILADAYFPRWWNAKNGQTPAEMWSELRAMKANFAIIPHQLADTGNVPTDWDFVDEQAQPVAEIFQTRGSYEYKGTPREAKRSTPAGYFIQDAWARGIVIGVIASPDHGGGRGKACVYAPELTREAILDALRARHCFGTTASRVFLDVRVNGHLMGEKIPAAGGKPVTVQMHVRCPVEIERVEVCRNNEFVYTSQPEAKEANLTFTDTEPVDGKSYYYVRVIQTDEEIAWSSPVWLGYE